MRSTHLCARRLENRQRRGVGIAEERRDNRGHTLERERAKLARFGHDGCLPLPDRAVACGVAAGKAKRIFPIG